MIFGVWDRGVDVFENPVEGGPQRAASFVKKDQEKLHPEKGQLRGLSAGVPDGRKISCRTGKLKPQAASKCCFEWSGQVCRFLRPA